MPALRVRVLALVAALAVTPLAGCRAEPAVAAYLGDSTVTIEQVDRVTADLRFAEADRSVVTGYVLGSLIIRDVGRRLAAARAVQIGTETSTAMVARYYDLPADARIVSLVTDTQNILVALAADVTPVEPDLDQQRAAYDALYFAGGRPVSGRYTFEQVQYLLNRDVIGRMIALRRILDEAVAGSGITVNPRYAGLTYGLPVSVPINEATQARASILVHLTVDEVPVEEV